MTRRYTTAVCNIMASEKTRTAKAAVRATNFDMRDTTEVRNIMASEKTRTAKTAVRATNSSLAMEFLHFAPPNDNLYPRPLGERVDPTRAFTSGGGRARGSKQSCSAHRLR